MAEAVLAGFGANKPYFPSKSCEGLPGDTRFAGAFGRKNGYQ